MSCLDFDRPNVQRANGPTFIVGLVVPLLATPRWWLQQHAKEALCN